MQNWKKSLYIPFCRFILFTLFLSFSTLSCFSASAQETQEILASTPLTGIEVMEKMRNRADGDDRQGTMTMKLINKRGAERVRVLEQISKDDGKNGMDRKSLITFVKPADVDGTKFLSWTYDAINKDDDKWLYMPALKKVRRISGSANNDFFMGSDFTYDDIDMGRRNLSKDTHTVLSEEKYKEYDCWKVESIPVDKKDPVMRRVTWVDKKTHLVVHAEYYDKKGLTRVYDVLKLQEQEGFWAIEEAQMKNLANDHKTVLSFGPYTYNQGFDDALFQVAVLQRGSR